MNKIFDGLGELNFGEFEFTIKELEKIKIEKIISLIDDYLTNQSIRLFYTNIENSIFLDNKSINTKYKNQFNLKFKKNNFKFFFYEILENSNVYISSKKVFKNLELIIKTDQNHDMHNLGYNVFTESDYSFFENNEKISLTLESESFGSINKKILFIKNNETKFVFDLLDKNNLLNEFNSLQNYLKKQLL